MIRIGKKQDPRQEKLYEDLAAKIEKQEALIDYVAIMADVDIPEEVEDHDVQGDVH